MSLIGKFLQGVSTAYYAELATVELSVYSSVGPSQTGTVPKRRIAQGL